MNSNQPYQLIGVFLLITLSIMALLQAAGFDGLVGQDSYEYLRYTDQIKQFYLTGEHPGYFFWPKGYPLIAGIFSLVIPTPIALQLVSVLSLSGLTFFTFRIIKLIYPNNSHAHIFVLIGILLSPYLLRSGLLAMSDVLAVFCLIGSFYYGLNYRKSTAIQHLLLCVFLGVYSVFTRYAAIVPVFILFVTVFVHWAKNVKLSHLFVLTIPAILIPTHFYFESKSMDFIQHEWLLNWHFSNFLKSDFTTVDGIQQNAFPNLIYTLFPFFHPGFFIGGSLFIFSMIKLAVLKRNNWKENNELIIILGIILYAVFLGGIPFQNNRFLLLTYPLIMVLLYAPFDQISERFFRFKKVFSGLFIIIQLVLFTRAIYPSYQLNRLEQSISQQLQPYQKATLYCFDIDVAIQGRGLDFNYQNMWVKEYDFFEKKSLVLFNPEKLSKQWKGKNPMINWNHLNEKYPLKLIKELGSGWKLYRIG